MKPTVNFMAPKKVCQIMHAVNKGTLDETFIIRQIVGAIMIAECVATNGNRKGNGLIQLLQ